MTDFTITEDFPRSEIEFDARFSNPEACYQVSVSAQVARWLCVQKMRLPTVLAKFKEPVYLYPV